MNKNLKEFLKFLILLVIVFVNFKLIILNKGYYNGQPLGGAPTDRYINHGALYNILGQSKIVTFVIISVISAFLICLVYKNDILEKDKKKKIAFIIELFAFVLIINAITMFIGVHVYM